MTVNSSTPMLSSTLVSNVCPVLALADCRGVVVRTIMTLPAGKTTRDWAEAAEAAKNANAMLHNVLRHLLSDILGMFPPDELRRFQEGFEVQKPYPYRRHLRLPNTGFFGGQRLWNLRCVTCGVATVRISSSP